MPRRRRRRGRAVPLAVAALLLAASAYLAALYLPRTHEGGVVRVGPGLGVRGIARMLEERGVVGNRWIFTSAVMLSGKAGRLKTGCYRFPSPVSTADVAAILAAGSHQAGRVLTLPEGLFLRHALPRIADALDLPLDTLRALARDPVFLRVFGVRAASAEGYVFPDTYEFRCDVTARDALSRLMRELGRRLTREDSAQARRRGMTMHQVLTLASIVEAETAIAGERPRVAGVYANRLRIGMPLQADPTVQYLLPDGPRRLLYRDLAIESPYNTYRHAGLPPGPVNSPGIASIRAALRPERHSYLYFVADGSGGHRFSRTAAEHALAVAAYRRMRDRQQ
jgi:UPF0755 protein